MAEDNSRRDEVTRLLVRNQSMLFAFVYAFLEDWHLAEDVVQETAVYVTNHWEDFEPGTNFGAWARKVARLRCLEALRHERYERDKRDKRSCLADEIEDSVWESSGQYSSDERRALDGCLRKLPEKSRALVVDRYQRDRSCAGVAKKHRMSVNAVYMALMRIRKLLRECVERGAKGAAAQ